MISSKTFVGQINHKAIEQKFISISWLDTLQVKHLKTINSKNMFPKNIKIYKYVLS